MNNAYIFDVIRTPRGKGKSVGALHESKPITLLTCLLKALVSRNQLEDTSHIEDLILGCATPVEGQGANIARAALLYAGWDKVVGGFQINRLSGSGLEAVNLAATKIRSGWSDMLLAGGVESLSRIPIESDKGASLYDPDVISKIGFLPFGVAADLLASLERFTREELDAYALQSQERALLAQTNGYFDQSIIPIKDQNGLLILDKDEHIRRDTSLESLAALPPSFQALGESGFGALALRQYPQLEKIEYLHTAGSSSGFVDGAALALIGSEQGGKAIGLTPRAVIRAVAMIGCEPTMMMGGFSLAVEKVLKMANLNIQDIDLWEVNEAFAAPVLKLQKDLELDSDIVNVNGGALSLGHPLGATGTMLIGVLLDELERRNLNIGLVSMSVGGGMGVATIIERTDKFLK